MTLYLYPGSFSPLHVGHLSIAQYLEEKYSCKVVFELCREPYDKEELSDLEVEKRCRQFNILDRDIIVSYDVSFLQKTIDTEGFHSTYSDFNQTKYFIVGADTIQRIDDKKYYFDSEKEKIRCLKLIAERQWKFLVFPRNGKLDDGLSQQIKDMSIFHADFVNTNISSTELRNQKVFTQLESVTFGKCFILNGQKYKLIKNSLPWSYNTCKMFNGEEFINQSFHGVLVEKVDEDFYPYMDADGNKI